MAREGYGRGRMASKQELRALRRILGLDVQKPIDLNSTSVEVMAAHPLIGKRMAAQIANLRERQPIRTPADLYRARVIDARQLTALEQVAFGSIALRPMITNISVESPALYIDEPFIVQVEFTPSSLIQPELISINVRFPSGKTGHADFSLSEEELRAGRTGLGEFISVEAGDFHMIATLRDEAGNVHQQTATFGVFTRNPVRMYITPSYWTQSGNVGAPKFDFGLRRWYCYANVRWVNSTSSNVNLGRTVTVRMTDAGSHIGTFSFNLSSDIIILPMTTVYGNLYTWHPEGSSAFDVFHAKGDLTFQYSMSGSGFTPTISQIWRTMRVIGYNIIRVGDFTATERSEYRRAAAEIASAIFQSRDMTVYGVELYRIEGTPEMDADKARFRFIDSQDEINALRDRYTVDNWFLDVFFVEGRWDGAFGSSPTDGPVDKQGNNSGLVLRRDSDTVNLGQTFAHEAGHYLGLEHADEDDGCDDTDPSDPNISDNFIFSSSRRDSEVITLCQIDKMRRHGLVRSLTP
jgi:Metallo-peptidase family M12B Reprolysin-like